MLKITGFRLTQSQWSGFWVSIRMVPLIALVLTGMANQSATGGEVVINEIHYNPGKWTGDSEREKQEEEFVELHNPGTASVALQGWRFARGIDYVFGNVSIPAGGFLAVAADLNAFRRLHPGVENVVGAYQGQLSNSSEDVELQNASGEPIDFVEYADSGHWAKRRSTKLKSYDHWEWFAPQDGGGMSMELVDARSDNALGSAWASSVESGGTPGRPNSAAKIEAAPLIGKVEHAPAIPSSGDAVTVRAQIAHQHSAAVGEARVLYRRDGESRFRSALLADAGDGTWTGKIPPQSDGTIIEYTIEATSADGATRHWPELAEGAVKDATATAVFFRQALLLFQVDDGFNAVPIVNGEQNPLYRIIMPRREMTLLRSIAGRSSNNSVFNNRFNGTFVSVDPGGIRVRHQCGLRIRGNGSRSAFPPGLRLSFASDGLWKGVRDINLNSQHTHAQVLGAAIHQVLGFPAARATAVRLTINNEDWTSPGLPQFGHYTCNEVLDSDYVDSRFSSERDGNLYRGVGQANLNYRGDRVSNYRTYYRKRNHVSKDDFSDVIQICRALDRDGDASISDAQFLAAVNEIVDVDQWMRYFALDALLCNMEGGFPTGRGDDYAMFRGGDGRFRLLPYDLDSILGRGDPGEDLTKSIFSYGDTRGLRRLFKHPEVIRMYFRHIREFVQTSYRPDVINRIVDEVLGHWVPESERDEIKAFVPRRIAAVLSQIDGYTVVGSTLDYAGGFHRTTRPSFLLYGRFDPAEVVGVSVNGRGPTQMDLRAGTWMLRSTETAPLVAPGITPLAIEMKGPSGESVDRVALQIWYDNGKMSEVAGDLPVGETTWDAESGPYLVTNELIVPNGSTLRILAGTTVFFADRASMRVSGKLTAAGAESHPIRFAAPITGQTSHAQTTAWKGLVFDHAGECSIVHAGIHGVDTGVLQVTDTSLTLDHVEFGRSAGTVITAANAALRVSDCSFAGAGGFVSANGGSVAIEDSLFGEPEGEFAIVLEGTASGFGRIKGNTFAGGGTAGGIEVRTDSLIMGNLFGAGQSPAETVAVAVRGEAAVVVAGNGFLGWGMALGAYDQSHAVFEKNTCRFCANAAVSWRADAVRNTGNLVATADVPVAFAQPDSAWVTRGKQASWALLELSGTPGTLGAHAPLLSVSGVPPTGKCAPGPREIGFHYPGAANFQIIGSGKALNATSEFDATAVITEGTSIGIEVTDLTGKKIAIPEAASWESVPGHVDVMINEVLAVNAGAFTGKHGHPDAVELFNYGSTSIDIGGFGLTDDPEEVDRFVFPIGTVIAPGGYAVVELGVKRPAAGALAAAFALSADGEQVLLFGAKAAQADDPIDVVTFGSQVADYSLGRVAGAWQLCEPTLGAPNLGVSAASPRSVRLSEWLASAGSGTSGDFIELRNTAPMPANISGCGLTDNIANEPFLHRFPPMSYLPADGVKAFHATGKPRGGQLNFKLSDDGEVLGFLSPEGVSIDWAAFHPQAPGRSQGRDTSGNLVSFTIPTPGTLPGAQGVAHAAALAAALRISEIHYNPSGDGDAEFLELANVGALPLDLTGVRITGGVGILFQEGTILDPSKRMVLVNNRKAFANAYGDTVTPHAEYSGKLSNGGEKLRVESPEGIPVLLLDFSDKWYKQTDGGGKSLEAVDLTAEVTDWSRKKTWKPSEVSGGTPGH